MKRRLLTVRGAVALVLFATISVQAQVTFDRLLHTDKEPHNWLTYSGNIHGQRYSLLNQINTGNVKNLELQWIWQAPSLEKFETTSIVNDGILYTIQAPAPNNITGANAVDSNTQIVALDAATGRPFWRFSYTIPMGSRACCGRVNRGVAILGDTLYMGTLNSHLIAVGHDADEYVLEPQPCQLDARRSDCRGHPLNRGSRIRTVGEQDVVAVRRRLNAFDFGEGAQRRDVGRRIERFETNRARIEAAPDVDDSLVEHFAAAMDHHHVLAQVFRLMHRVC